MLHPDLARLQERYNAVLDEFEAGNLSYEDALTAVQAMGAIDGSGYLWVIDTASGAFLRSTPGELPEPADPASFSPAQIPARGSSPWASQQDLLSPPSRTEAPSARADSWEAEPEDPYQHIGRHVGRHDEQRAEAPRRARPKRPSVSVRRITDAVRVPPVLRENARLLLVVAAVAVFLVVVLFRGGDDAPAVTESLPSVPAVSDESPTPSTPVSPAETTPPTTAPSEPVATDPAALVPSVGEMNEVLRQIATGQQPTIVALVASEQIEGATYERRIMWTARYAGYDRVGLQMTAGPAALDESGQAVATISLVDAVTADVVGTAPAGWVRDATSGRWILVAHIDFVPTA